MTPDRSKGDQPRAIACLVEGINGGERYQNLLGVNGTSKTFKIAHVIAQTSRPALVLSNNKILAVQVGN